MIDLTNKTLLVVAPHFDDEVIGCGGLMTKVKEAGGKAYVLYLTVGATQDFSQAGESTVDGRMDEVRRVMDHFEVDGWRVALLGDEYHLRLDATPQRQIIHELERGDDISLAAVKPDIITFPEFGDYNQDHRAAARAAFAACRPAPQREKFTPSVILQSEAPMSAWSYPEAAHQPNFIVGLSEAQLEKKVGGMEMYETQVRGPGHPRNSATLRAQAMVRGSLIGEQYGEAFNCLKLHV